MRTLHKFTFPLVFSMRVSAKGSKLFAGTLKFVIVQQILEFPLESPLAGIAVGFLELTLDHERQPLEHMAFELRSVRSHPTASWL